ncbi:MAG: type II toxin-antitoxin system HicB family antitoxin [Candidatus Sumerlaeota bacterium]|nr:type II toxin-antitoxin system HicB family antitoxin [Candidatus Sumerlaeota bacterium]
MKREFSVVIEKDEKGWLIASVPELRGCYTQTRSLDTLMKRIREVIELCLAAEAEDCAAASGTQFLGIHRVAI